MVFKADSFGKRISLGRVWPVEVWGSFSLLPLEKWRLKKMLVLLRGDTTEFITWNTLLPICSIILAPAPNPHMQPQINTSLFLFRSYNTQLRKTPPIAFRRWLCFLLQKKRKIKTIRLEFLLFSLSSPNIFIHTHSYLLLADVVEEEPMCSSSSGPLHHQFSPRPCVANLPISTGFLPSTYA